MVKAGRKSVGKTTLKKEEENIKETAVENLNEVQLSLLLLDEKENEEKENEEKNSDETKLNIVTKPRARKPTIACTRCKRTFPRELLKEVGEKKYCEACFEYLQSDEHKALMEVKDKISEILKHDRNDTKYVISIVIKQINLENWDVFNVLSTLNYIIENNLTLNATGVNLFFIIQCYYGAGTRQRFEEQLALASVPDNVDEILNKKVRVIEKKRSAWIRDNELSEERRKYIEYGPKIDLNNILED